jgi:HD-GYP domain-containing protein (c-di-GMP phosphodiesterase class II)
MENGKIKRSSLRRVRFLSKVAEVNDGDTWNHTLRINLYSSLLAGRLGLKGEYYRQIGLMAQMHDVGKVRIRRAILDKPGQLSASEFAQVQRHPVLGAQMLGPDADLAMARDIALCHHERYDGTGYPRGVAGVDIPLCGRIVAVADVYDALRSRRPYKPALPHEEAMRIICSGRERTRPEHFDPEILAAFRENEDSMDSIYQSYRDRRSRPRSRAA